jgi:hypothetical protein
MGRTMVVNAATEAAKEWSAFGNGGERHAL